MVKFSTFGIIATGMRHSLFLTFFPLFLLLIGAKTEPFLRAQQDDTHFQHLSIDEGLSNLNVTSITQDSLGFLWFGTEEGLNRYDGYAIKIYKYDPTDSSALSWYWISSLCIDLQGTLWIGTPIGLNRYDRTTDKFIRYFHDPQNDNSLQNNSINQLTTDGAGNLLIATSTGMDYFDPSTNHFVHFRHDSTDTNTPGASFVGRIFTDSRGVVWIWVSEHGINAFYPRLKKFIRYPFGRQDSSGSISPSLTWLSEDANGRIWMGTWGSGIDILDPSTNKFSHHQKDSRSTSTFGNAFSTVVARRHAGGMWIGTFDAGLEHIDVETKTYRSFRNDPNNPLSLSSDRVIALCEDRVGRLWIGTSGGGVNVYDPWRKPFTHIWKVDARSNGLNDNTVWAFYEDRRGEVWIGTDNGGLNRYDPKANRFSYFLHDPKDPQSLTANLVKSICEDSFGQLWIATSSGLDRFDRVGKFKHYRHDPNNPESLGDDEITVVYEDREGDLWVATHQGLARYDRARDRFIRQFRELTFTSQLTRGEIQFLHQDTQGELWIGTFGDGVYRFNKKTKALAHYVKPSLPDNGAYAMNEDPSGGIWISTFRGGLSRYDRQKDEFRHYSERDGLPSNYVKGILCDDRRRLWLSTMRGISRFDPQTGMFTNFGPSEGIQANEFRTGSCFRAKDGKMYFGGVNGYNVFHPDSIHVNPIAPPVVLTSFKIFDKSSSLGEAIATIREIRLAYAQDVFSFEFVALNYTNAEKNQYAYKLEGLDNDWVYSGARRYAGYTHLDPGEYTFHVKASNNDGVWNEKGVNVRLIVIPPVWMTWWFRASAIVALFLFVGWGVRSVEMRRIGEKMRRLEREADLERERARIARDMHDDLGSRLTEIRMLSELTQRGMKDDRTAKSNLEEISESAREIVGSFQEIVWSVNPKYDTLDNLADFLTQFASGYLGKVGLRCRLDIPPILPGYKVSSEVRHNLMMVVKEALNNTAKHAAASEVNISLVCEDRHLRVVVEDDGKGFAAANARRLGNGLDNMRQRLESIGGELRIESGSGIGTSVTINVLLAESGK